MIDGVINADAIPVLERSLQFAAARHEVIAGNIANFSTPNYLPQDLSVERFQESLREAVDRRREAYGSRGGDLKARDTAQVAFRDDSIAVQPTPIHDNILFHDRNDRDIERTMQSMVENFMTFRMASQFMRSRFEVLNQAIAERL